MALNGFEMALKWVFCVGQTGLIRKVTEESAMRKSLSDKGVRHRAGATASACQIEPEVLAFPARSVTAASGNAVLAVAGTANFAKTAPRIP